MGDGRTVLRPDSVDFAWGVSSASCQVEGAWNVDGKLPSIWDEFSAADGAIVDGSSPKQACDLYHRFVEDIALASKAGFRHFRMSIAWPRVMHGDGSPNELGLAFYDRMLDALESADISPWVTLYHWDLPAHLHTDINGWMNPIIVDRFTAFAQICFERFSKRITKWITFNEPAIFVFGGYQGGWQAPGIEQPVSEALWAMRHVLLAHASVVDLFRKSFQFASGSEIGIALNSRFYIPVDGSDLARQAAQTMLETRLGCWADPVMLGRFPETFLSEHPGNAALVLTEAERVLLRGSVDFLGVNYYTSSGIRADGKGGWYIVDVGDTSGAAWLRSCPPGFAGILRWVSARYANIPIAVTENGMCTASADPYPLEDVARVEYYEQHVREMWSCMEEGIDVKAYFAWTLLDNWEWTAGFTERFGLVHVDFENPALPRTCKLSYKWWQSLLKPEGVGNASAGMRREKLQTTPLEVQRVLKSFGQSAEGCSVMLLLTDMSMPKYIIELKDGTKLFMGSIFGNSKGSDNVVASMRAASCAAGWVPACMSIGGYLSTTSGELLVQGERGRRWMLVPCFDEKQASTSDKYTPQDFCSYKLPATLGALHIAFRQSGANIEGLKYYPAVKTFYESRARLQDCMASTSAMPADLKPVLPPVERVLAQLQETDVAALDSLPRQVVHSDFQPKNLMLSPDGSCIRICDTETMLQGPRVFDLLFIFMGSDDGEFVGRWDTTVDRLEEYLAASWPLSEVEVQAVPIALANLTAGIAVWAACKFDRPGSYALERLTLILTGFSKATGEFSDFERVRACCRLANCFTGGPAVSLEAYTTFYGAADLGMAIHGLPVLETGKKGAAVFFNGTFSPVHEGHLATAESAANAVKELGFDEVRVVFSPCHDSHEGGKLKQLCVGVKHRAAMLEVTGVIVDLYEASRDAAAMGLEGVQSAFVRRLPANYTAFFLMGADVANWRWIRRKVALGFYVLILVNRPGFDARVEACERSFRSRPWPGCLHVVHCKDTGKSSTRIRAAAAGEGDLAAEVGIPKVAEYMVQHRLYKPE